jgi:hypothetical protein
MLTTLEISTHACMRYISEMPSNLYYTCSPTANERLLLRRVRADLKRLER